MDELVNYIIYILEWVTDKLECFIEKLECFMAEWTDIVFKKSANYFNKINEINAANTIFNNRDIIGKRLNEIFVYLESNYGIKIDEAGYVYFEGLKPAEKRGLYDLYIENHMDIPDTISKDSPCYKQFIKEKKMNK